MDPDILAAGALFKALGPLLASIGAVMVILAKLIDRLIPNPTDKLLRKIAMQTQALHEAHLGDSAIDDEGRKKWWFPQGMVTTLEHILDTQKETLVTLKQLSEKMDMGAVLGESQMIMAAAVKSLAATASENAGRERGPT